MNINNYLIIFHLLLFSCCLCEVSEGEKEKILNGFLKHYNSLSNQIYQSNEGFLQSTQQVDDNLYQIVAKIKVKEIQNEEVVKSLTCTATVNDFDDHVSVTQSRCQEAGLEEPSSQEMASEAQVEVTEPIVERKPIQLDNEVQSDTAATSGEQFIAIPRDQPKAPCFGCATHVNPQAAGVSDLANLGLRHLSIHQPTTKHTLEQVLDVERQVQVVNGVRYILTLSVNFNNCTDTQSDNCVFSDICKITFLVKPWVKMPSGANYRAILGNNCTDVWLYGDNGEVVPETIDNRTHDKDEDNKGDVGDEIQVKKHNTDVQSLPTVERTLTDEEMKNLEDQIIPNNNKFQENNQPTSTVSPETPGVSKEHVFKVESSKRNENSIPTTEPTLNINLDKKKAIDDLLNFFDFSGFKSKNENADTASRVRRSYDYDLQLLSLTEDYHGIKNSLENARFIYGLAQTMVNYLNEIDMEVKNRAVKSVIKAEEETDSLQRYIYIQVSVTIPCEKVECEPKDSGTQICNGVIDATNDDSPQIISSFCYNDNKETGYRNIVNEIPLDDPILQNLAIEAVQKIESESKSENALNVNKIVSAITQVTSGTLTKFSIIVDTLKCNKSVPLALRTNCKVLEQLGSKICEIIVHERHWLGEKKISYSCTERPVDMKISKVKSVKRNVKVDDPKIIEMLQEAIQFLETQSERNNKQKIVNVMSISSQVIAGFLTKIEFIVGYTNCTDGNELIDESNKCQLLNGEKLRLCKAQFWDRSWIMDGRQVEVSCDDVNETRKKRSVNVVESQENENRNSELKYKKLANESLNKFMQSSPNHRHYELIKVEKVHVQNVPDKLIRIQFSISPTNCILKNGILSPTGCHVINPENIIQCRSKILENVWIDKTQFFVNCNLKDYQQQDKALGLQERESNDLKSNKQKSDSSTQNLENSNYMPIAVEALQQYLKNNTESLLLRVTFVDKVVTEGLITKIVFLASHTEDDDGDTICYAEFSATNTSKIDTEVKCHSMDLTFRQAKITDEDPSYNKYVQLADESLYIYLQKLNSSQLYTIANIESVVVLWDEGVKTQINFIISPTDFENDDMQGKRCLAEIREQPWVHKKDVDVKCVLEKNLYRSKRDLHGNNKNRDKNIRNNREKIVGGLTDQDPNDPQYRVLAEESLKKFVADSGTTQPLLVVRVEKVATQVVSGIMTHIDFVISGGQDINKCHSKIWEQPWINKKDIKITCNNDGRRTKRHAIPGGLKDQDPNDPKYKVLAEESLQKFVADSGTTQPLLVVRVEKVATQVVSGEKTHIDFVISGGQDINKCHSEIWEQPWINKKDIKITCNNDGRRTKRHAIPGGLKDQDPNDPKYKVLAEESLQKFVADSGTTQPLLVVRVEKVATQVVSGIMTHIDFVISGGQDINKCHSEIWEQPWINKKDIKITCNNDGRRTKRHTILGGLKDQDPNDPKYKVLAEESLQKFVADSGTTQPLLVVRVEKVATQVVSGKKTHIDFVISGGQDINKCHSEIWEQPWINKKDIKITCNNDGRRTKRHAIPGGLKDQDPNDPKYKVLAEESLQKFVADSGTTQPLLVVRVEKVATQVVSGIMTHIDFVISGGQDINKCHSKIWEQPWINKKDIKITCNNDGRRTKRHAIPGGLKDQDPNDPKYKVLAEESLQKFVADSGTTQPLLVVRVEKVATQVVSGKKTHIDFVISGGQDINKCHSEIWEQPWINKKDIKITCNNDGRRTKRHAIPGGLKDQDPNDPKYKVLAEESLQKFVADSGTTQPLLVVRVEKVATQVVSGIMTHIDFVISGGQDINKCHSKIWEQPWINKKDIKITCNNDGRRTKRHAIPGGLKDQDPNDPKYKVLAEESLQKFVADSGTTQPLLVVRVEKVATQVVSGKKTHIDFVISGGQDINKCHSEIWEQPWINKKDIKITCNNDGRRTKRHAILGGLKDQDPNDPKYKVLAEESLQKFVADSGTTQPLLVVRVEKVATQVVSGIMTHIDFVISGGQDINKCHSKIWEQPWINKKDIKITCNNDGRRTKRHAIPGGLKDQDPNDPKYKVLAEESLQKFVADSGTTQPLLVVRVEKVATQVVSGKKTHIDFVISGGQDINKCHSEIWEQPWINKKDIKITCNNDGRRTKRHTILGGLKDQDPNDPKYKVLAEESLQKFVADSGTTQPLLVVRVEKVATQVVSGKKTHIDFVISGGQDINKCHSEIWEQPWINKKDIKITCNNDGRRTKRQAIPGGLKDQDPNDPKLNIRVRRDLGMPRSLVEHNFIKPEIHVPHRNKLTAGNTSEKSIHNVRGNDEEEQNPNKPEYKLLAEESLRKFQQKSAVYHKVLEVKRVLTRVVSGLKYNIDFTAAPTDCSVNVSRVNTRRCKTDDHVILYCHTEVWDRPWLRKKNIDVQCNDPSEDRDDFVEDDDDDIDVTSNPENNSNNTAQHIMKLADEATEKYLTASNRKYFHKVTGIQSVSEQFSDGTLTTIDYTMSPTNCLRNVTNKDSCKVKQTVFHCTATIRNRSTMNNQSDIEVTCKKASEGIQKSKKHKRDVGIRNARQVGDDDEEMDEDMVYYYADRAVQHLNEHSSSNNLNKLISIHAVQSSVQMGTMTVKMYIEVAETYCLRHKQTKDLKNCEELNGLNHRLCLARIWPAPDEELITRHISVVCDDDDDFVPVTGVNVPELLKLSLIELEKSPATKYKLVHQGEPQVIPSLDSRKPFKLNFIVAYTNCSKDVDLDQNPFQCYLKTEIPSKSCNSFIWLKPDEKYISYINVKCASLNRMRRATNQTNVLENEGIKSMVAAALEKLEMSSLHRYKQRVLQINSHSTKITSGKVTTIDFDVGYTSCLKYEWVEDITSCDFLEHLPRRRCVAQIWERLWIKNGQNIDVNCVDDETPLESHIEFESAEMANALAREALKHIEAKYPHPSKQKVVRIFSLEKQVVAGIHYKMKIEVGFTDCVALSDQTDCKLLKNHGLNKFCRVNVWVRPWTDHPPNFRVSCDFQEGTTHDLYHHVQAEQLFYNFLTTYSPSYINDYSQMQKRFEIFKNNIKKIHEFNVHEKGTAVYGVTRFTDLTYEEFSSTYMGLNTKLTNENQVPMKKADIPNIKLPEDFDWREHDAVTEVKDQGSCGSCWAFSVTGNIEGQWKMQSGQLVSLSEQELVDCDKLDDGCNGGLPDNAYRAIEQMGGLELESDYPYEGVGDKCEFNKTLAKVQISGAVNITTNETGMAQWLVHNGPISIGINANAMQFYMGGISHPWKMLCNPTNLDHGVLIVGYGIKDYPLFHKKLPYWIIKNSWGKSWGEQGYYRVYRGDGTCGVNQMASSAII